MQASLKRSACWRPGAALAFAVFILDQVSKWWIVGHVMRPPRVIEVLPVDGEAARRYDARPGTVYLLRPDQHVCWRGDALPENPGGLLDIVTGRD